MISPNENQSDLMAQDASTDVDEFTSIVSLLDAQEISLSMPQPSETSTNAPRPKSSPKATLRTKATVLAALLGSVPVAAVGGIGFITAQHSLKQQITQQHDDQAQALIDTVNRFVFERYRDVQMMAQSPSLTGMSPNRLVDAQQKATLEQFKQIYGVYDSIALFDRRGNVLVKTSGPASDATTAQADVQAVVKTGKTIVSQLQGADAAKQGAIYFTVPLIDTETKKIVKVIRARLPLSALQAVTAPFGNQYQLFRNDGTIFLSNQTELLNRKIQEVFATVPQLDAMQPSNAMIVRANGQSSDQLLAYAATPTLKGMPNLNWGVTYVKQKQQAFQSINDLAVALSLGTIATGVIASTIAITLTSRTTRSLKVATDAVEKIGQGDLDTRLDVQSHDELGRLGENINQMVEQLQMVLSKQARQAHYAQILNELVNDLRQSLQRDDILASTPAAVREALHADRVVIYQFEDDWSGKITAESINPKYDSILGEILHDPFQPELIEAYRNGRVRAIHDISGEHLTPFHQELWLTFDSQANMVAPLIQNERLIGLICAHQCDAPRQWEAAEVELFAQVAVQVGYALEQAYLLEYAETAKQEAQQEAAELAQEQQQQKEFLQRRALELLMEVDPVSQGDLTIRAKVTPDEVGTIADSYNSIIRSLRQLVLDVQSATETVSQTASSNESSVQQLSHEARRQMAAITEALIQVQSTVESVKGVTARALEAEQGVHLAAATIADGDIAMNKTVAGISAIRETVSETAKKVKRLGEASQKISKVVNLINGFAAQTNLLALNAAIEAARAGEEGRGFAVVAEEVRSLAQQSAAATEEIEQLVEEIQTQTNDVVLAMEAGTEQVVEGTQLVEETRIKLNEITAVSATINRLIGEISAATTVQTKAYETVSQTMEQVAMIADDSSKQSDHVAESFTRLLSVADALQVSVAQFKVN